MNIYVCSKCLDNQCVLEDNMDGQPAICPYGIVTPKWEKR